MRFTRASHPAHTTYTRYEKIYSKPARYEYGGGYIMR